jgi:hypothetical protein
LATRTTIGLIGPKRSASKIKSESASSLSGLAAAAALANASGLQKRTNSAWTAAWEVVSTLPMTSPIVDEVQIDDAGARIRGNKAKLLAALLADGGAEPGSQFCTGVASPRGFEPGLRRERVQGPLSRPAPRSSLPLVACFDGINQGGLL